MLWTSSLRLENNKSIFNAEYYKKENVNRSFEFKQPLYQKSWLYNRIFQNPAEIELYLRAELFSHKLENSDDLIKLYQILLSTKPTWPYYYSGLAQIDLTDKLFRQENVNKAVHYGVHERKVMQSLAEVLFYNWDNIEEDEKNILLEYLSNQKLRSIAQVVNISAKFSRVYEYCDFLYEKKRVEYAPCKRQYWQPLSK
jgi:hypothetical protein